MAGPASGTAGRAAWKRRELRGAACCSSRRASQTLWWLPGHCAGILPCAARDAGLGAAGQGGARGRCPMGGLRGLGGARAGGGLRLAAAGPALPRAGSLLLSQVPGGLGTSDSGVPACCSGVGGGEVGATPVMKEQPLETQGGGSLEVTVGACPGWAKPPGRLCHLLRLLQRRSLGLGVSGCGARPRPPPLPAAVQLSPRRSDGFFLPARRRQQLKEEQGALLCSARVWEGALNAAPRFRSSKLAPTQLLLLLHLLLSPDE